METKRTYKSFSYEDNITWKSGRRGVVRAAGTDVDVGAGVLVLAGRDHEANP